MCGRKKPALCCFLCYFSFPLQESEGLRKLVTAINATVEREFNASEVIVFKASARYHVVRDDALQAVIDNPGFDIW